MPTVTERRKKTIAQADALLARRSGEALTRLMQGGARDSYQFRVTRSDNAAAVEITLPDGAMQVLATALAEMAKGHAVMAVPAASDLTPQQAADLMGVSRPFLLQLIRAGHIPSRFVGTHRRLRLQDIQNYQAEQQRRDQILDELTAQAQELGMGY